MDVPNKTRPACIKTQYLLIFIHKYGIYSVVNKRMQTLTVFKVKYLINTLYGWKQR